MQRIKNVLAALLATLKPKSNKFEIETINQELSGLSIEEIQEIVQWIARTSIENNYFGKVYLIFDPGNQNIQDLTLTAILREEPMFLYKLAINPSPTQAGVKWELTQHSSFRLYQLVPDA